MMMASEQTRNGRTVRLCSDGNQGLVLHECLILSDIAPNPVVTHHVVIAPNPVVTLHLRVSLR